MTEQEWKNKIDTMSQLELGRLLRFSPSGHPVFDMKSDLYKYFEKRFKGMTPDISKELGW